MSAAGTAAAGEATGLLEGKVALITGSGGAQGRAAALAFGREGATVVGCDVVVDTSVETARLVRAAGGRMTTREPVDLSDHAQVKAWVDEAAQEHGGIDIVYNNAGSWRGAPIPDLSVEDWRFTLGSELDSVFFVTQVAWPHLVARGAGVIINIASTAAMAGADAQMIAHAATKGAVVSMTRQMAVEGASLGIRAVSISPGPVMSTERMEKLFDGQPELRDRIPSATLLKRWGKPEEVVELGIFLASDRAEFITGADYVIDGGMTAVR